MRSWLLPSLLLLLASCHSAGPYGYSRVYSPLAAERDAAEGARDYDPVMIERDLADWKKAKVSVFGIVLSRSADEAGQTTLKLSVRTLQDRNLCEELDEQTCRVTVSARERAQLLIHLKPSREDDLGERSLGRGSLVRVIGKISDEVDADGTPVVHASYYRHWPRHFYVTTDSRDDMRR